MELNSLPFDCLLLLLDLFPVKEQAQFRAVCTNWNELVVQLWRSVKNISIDYISAKCKCNIRFDNDSKVSCNVGSGLERFITREHFPGVTELTLDFSGDKDYTKKPLLSHILTQWAATLPQLTLLLPPETSHKYKSTIWTQIDSLKSLKSLILHLNFPVLSISGEKRIAWKIPANLTILTQLETFVLSNCGNDNDEIGDLTQLGQNLKYLVLQTLSPTNILSFSSIAPKLISLCGLCLNILQFAQPYLLDLLTSLAQLKQLSKIHFTYIHWDQFISLSTHHEYPKLTSVKHLIMAIENKHKPTNPRQHMDQFNQDFFTSFPIMFPSLETIYVQMYGLEDQPFVDMIEDKMKRKFVALSDIKFSLIAYRN